VIAELVALSHQLMNQLLPPLHPLCDQEEGGTRVMALKLSQYQGGCSGIGTIVQGQGNQRHF
jgi:hypothetical protein